MDERTKQKINNLRTAIIGLDGIPIPYNIIKHAITPLKEWTEQELKGV